MSETMRQAFGLVRRPWGVFHLKNKITGEQKSLKTSDKHEAQRILQAHNETESQPHFNLSLARVYLNGADPKLATRTWQEVMENIVAKKTDETRRRWDTAIKDRDFDCIRNLPVAETRPERHKTLQACIAGPDILSFFEHQPPEHSHAKHVRIRSLNRLRSTL
jgi:hypothetical protein